MSFCDPIKTPIPIRLTGTQTNVRHVGGSVALDLWELGAGATLQEA